MDGEYETIQCEGECGLWFHRGCVRVPPCRYKELSSSEEPFICLSYTNMQLKHAVIVKIERAEVHDKCIALAAEVASL